MTKRTTEDEIIRWLQEHPGWHRADAIARGVESLGATANIMQLLRESAHIRRRWCECGRSLLYSVRIRLIKATGRRAEDGVITFEIGDIGPRERVVLELEWPEPGREETPNA